MKHNLCIGIILRKMQKMLKLIPKANQEVIQKQKTTHPKNPAKISNLNKKYI